MNRKRAFGLGLSCVLALPLSAHALTRVGVVFSVESPQHFPEQTLGESKAAIEAAVSQQLVERLEFYFPFLDWEVGDQADDRLELTLVDREHGTCGWQSDLVVRAVRAGNEAEMTDVQAVKLYDLCDPFLPNRKDPTEDALNSEDHDALLGRLKQAVENTDPSPGEPEGLLNNDKIREAMHDEFFGTIPVTQQFEVREQTGGGKLLYLPVAFEELKSSTVDLSCEHPEDDCSRLRLTVDLAGSPKGTFTLRVVGECGDQVLCEVLEGGVPGVYTVAGRTYWEEEFGDLLSRARSLSFTMEGFTKAPFPCANLAGTGLFMEP